MRKLITTISGIVLIGLSYTAMAEGDGAALYESKTCWSCHGKDAKTPLMPQYPKIAGQNKDYALIQMKDIKSGVRSNGQSAAMKGVMGLVNDAEMEAIAEWLSTLN
ncbi:c-type cytochrome [Candidatus Halobeggiatoa sp. HSG11]|nr:c-type cytochrome [Candidatus Halobeggiatoa sp. HSG11]